MKTGLNLKLAFSFSYVVTGICICYMGILERLLYNLYRSINLTVTCKTRPSCAALSSTALVVSERDSHGTIVLTFQCLSQKCAKCATSQSKIAVTVTVTVLLKLTVQI